MPDNTLQHYLLHLLERNDQHILTSTEGSLDTVQVPLLCCPMEGLHWVFVHLVGLCNPPLLPCLIYSSAQHYIMGGGGNKPREYLFFVWELCQL